MRRITLGAAALLLYARRQQTQTAPAMIVAYGP